MWNFLRQHWRGALLALILTAGAAVVWFAPIDMERLLARGEALVQHPLTIIALILTQALLFTFALPGSLMLWLVAPFMTPLPATLVLLSGSMLGALGGYGFSHWLGDTARRAISDKPAFNILKRNSDVFTQCALRLLPGFPLAILNYTGGVLALPLTGFLLAALIGLGLKLALYTSAIHALIEAGEGEVALDIWHLMPLLALAAMLILGRLVRNLIVRSKAD